MRALCLPLLLIGCAEDGSDANEPPVIEMSTPEEGLSVEVDSEGSGVQILVVVSDEDPESLVALWETDKEGFQPDQAVTTGVGQDEIGFELSLPADTLGGQTLTFRVEDADGEAAIRTWNVETP